jgi:acetyltransferase-like isoleucine patch superfamily enzyme
MTRLPRFIRYLQFIFVVYFKGGFVSPLASITIFEGADFKISSKVKIYRHTRIVLAKNSFLSIGSSCLINPMSTILVRAHVTIGARVKIAHLCTIVDHNYKFTDNSGWSAFSADHISIGDDSILYASSVILKGVSLPPFTVIPCLSVVDRFNSHKFMSSP